MVEEKEMERRDKGWSLNKEIPVSVLITLGIQSIFVIIFFTKMDSRVANLEEKRQEDKQANMAISALPAQLMRNEYEVAAVKEGFKRLETKVDQLNIESAKRQTPP